MKLNWNTLLMLIAITAGLSSCRSNRNPKLMVKLVVDDTQERLGNNGLPAALPFGNAGQNPMFIASAHITSSWHRRLILNWVRVKFYTMLLKLPRAG